MDITEWLLQSVFKTTASQFCRYASQLAFNSSNSTVRCLSFQTTDNLSRLFNTSYPTRYYSQKQTVHPVVVPWCSVIHRAIGYEQPPEATGATVKCEPTTILCPITMTHVWTRGNLVYVMSMSLIEMRAYPSNIVSSSFLGTLRNDFGKHKDHLNSDLGNGSFRVYCHVWSGEVLLQSINHEAKGGGDFTIG